MFLIFICNVLSLPFLRKPDIIVEVAHPKITEQYGESFLEIADYMVYLAGFSLLILRLLISSNSKLLLQNLIL